METKYDRKDLREKMAGRVDTRGMISVMFVVPHPVSGLLEVMEGYDERGDEIVSLLDLSKI